MILKTITSYLKGRSFCKRPYQKLYTPIFKQQYFFTTQPTQIKTKLKNLLIGKDKKTDQFHKQAQMFKNEVEFDITKTIQVNKAICSAIQQTLGNKSGQYKAAIKQYAQSCLKARDGFKILISQQKIASTFQENDVSPQCIENIGILYHYYTRNLMHQKALDVIEKLINKVSKVDDQWSPRRVGALLFKSQTLSRLGRVEQNLQLLIFLQKNVKHLNPPTGVYIQLAQVYAAKRNNELSDKYIEKSKQSCQQQEKGGSGTTAWESLMVSIGMIYEMRMEYDKALKVYDDQLQIELSKNKRDQARETMLLMKKFSILHQTQNYQQKYKIAKILFSKQLFMQVPGLEKTLQTHANTCAMLGYLEEARQYWNKIINIYQTKVRNPQALLTMKITPMFNIGFLYLRQGNYKMAAQVFEQAESELMQAYQKGFLGRDKTMEIYINTNLFLCYFFMENPEKSEQYGKKSWELLESTINENNISSIDPVVVTPILEFYYHYAVTSRMHTVNMTNYSMRYHKFVKLIEKVKSTQKKVYFSYLLEKSIFEYYQSNFKQAQNSLKIAEQWCDSTFKGTSLYDQNLSAIKVVKQILKQNDQK